jgi:NadR type nicotinamide-nucleotide adenylyltransferase
MESSINPKLKHIVVTGPESTGKTMLCEKLARHYRTVFIPEYARDYILSLDKPYTYDDVLHIAGKQVELVGEYAKKAKDILFYDTYLIITKVWFDVVFDKHPQWLDVKLFENKIDLYLLCAPDIPWIPDPVRENGGKMRDVLFRRYLTELKDHHSKYEIIRGKNRFEKAVGYINNILIA